MSLADELKRVEDAERAVSALGKAFDAKGLEALLQVVAGHPDMGAPGAGEVIASLFMLIEAMLQSRCCDREALAVHTRAWRLMLAAEPDADAKAALLKGLKAVRDLYTASKAA